MRNRMTWKEGSAPPAMPTEDGGHPASQPDPAADKYENGDTSSWAEDPTKGPYKNSPAPAMPQEGGDKAASLDIRVAAEKKAAKCIRIAQALLGDNASSSDIEDQAFPFMHLADDHLNATLERIAQYSDLEDGEVKEASVDRLAALEATVGELVNEIKSLREANSGEKVAKELTAEQMLSEMVAEEAGKTAALSEDEILSRMLDEMRTAAKKADDDGDEDDDDDMDKEAAEKADDDVDAGKTAAKYGDDDKDEDEDMDKEASWDVDLGADEDGMGLTASIAENDSVLASLYEKSAGGSEDGDEDEDEDEMADKKASLDLKPKPRNPAKGAQTLGTVGMDRTAAAEVNDLSKLWESAPDITDYFSTK